MTVRLSVILVTVFVFLCAAAFGQQADVAIIKATFSIAERPAEGRGSVTFSKIIESALSQSAVLFDMLTEEQVEEGSLAGYKLVIFPYSAVWHEREIERTLEYVRGGGKLMCFYTAPAELRGPLGFEMLNSPRAEYEGQFQIMTFTEDRPKGFPALVHQDSPNLAVVRPVGGGRVIANWHDKDSVDTGFPAVVLSENGVYVSHVFKSGNQSEQALLVLATLGHFVPGSWDRMVEGMLAEAGPAAGFDSLDELIAATAGVPDAEKWAASARALQEEATVALAAQEYERALGLARQSQDDAQRAATGAFSSRPHELRGAWMGFPSDETDWEAIMSELEAANFNALFPLMCDGNVAAYPSAYLPQFTENDQLKLCIEAAHRHGVEVHPWRVNWCILRATDEERQQLADEGLLVLAVEQARGEEEAETTYRWSTRWRDPSDDINRDLEYNAMIEMVEKYDVDGIHFDYMRYPSKFYCYCDRCRSSFEEWAGITVENWPDDCWDGGPNLEAFRDWRRMLQTSLVKRIADRARELDPNVMISLAARASVTGAPENDAQDWRTWAHERYLDMLCPMDYTSSVEVLRRKLEPQMEQIDGAIPVYAGIGVSPSRSASPVNLSQQIQAARELGADGFLLFSLTSFSRGMLPAIGGGVTSEPVAIMPHHRQLLTATFRYPDGIEGAEERTYAVDTVIDVGIRLRAVDADVASITLQVLTMPAVGGEVVAIGERREVPRDSFSSHAELSLAPGIHQVILRGEVASADGKARDFYFRSRPITVLSHEATDELLGRLKPPIFATDRPHVGVVANGYGSDGIMQALAELDSVEVQIVRQLVPEFLAPCDALILPQPRGGPEAMNAAAITALREFVRAGGGLLMTHDAVGMRGHPAVFPEIAAGGKEPVRQTTVAVVGAHPIAAVYNAGAQFEHSYFDHVPVVPTGDATVVAVNADGQPVVAAGTAGQGRYVAWGMATGLGAGDAEVAPEGGESALLVGAVRWLVGQLQEP